MNKSLFAAATSLSLLVAPSLNADHQNDDPGLVWDGGEHFTTACSDENGNTSDYSLSIYHETASDEFYGGHFVAAFNFISSLKISPYSSPIHQGFDPETKMQRFIFPLSPITLSDQLNEDEVIYKDTRRLLINNAANTVQIDVYTGIEANQNPDKAITCDIPYMGLEN